jgi:hypothetical protein
MSYTGKDYAPSVDAACYATLLVWHKNKFFYNRCCAGLKCSKKQKYTKVC